jgi:hypothetical protein
MQPKSTGVSFRRAQAQILNAELRAKVKADERVRREASWAAAKAALKRQFDEIAKALAGQPEASVHAALLEAVSESSVTPDEGDLRPLARRIANGSGREE